MLLVLLTTFLLMATSLHMADSLPAHVSSRLELMSKLFARMTAESGRANLKTMAKVEKIKQKSKSPPIILYFPNAQKIQLIRRLKAKFHFGLG